jgi:enamine deaminase RidA (YjgF/YER057c/UK114 family)
VIRGEEAEGALGEHLARDREVASWGDRPNPPVITAAAVKGLAHPDFLVEMDAIAVVPA